MLWLVCKSEAAFSRAFKLSSESLRSVSDRRIKSSCPVLTVELSRCPVWPICIEWQLLHRRAPKNGHSAIDFVSVIPVEQFDTLYSGGWPLSETGRFLISSRS